MWVQFPAANSAFSEKCFASFHAVQGCFSTKVICQDWTCNYSKDKLTHLNLNLLHASFIFCLQSVALLKKKHTCRETPYFTWKHDWKLRQGCCIPTNFWEDHASWKDLYFLQWIVYCNIFQHVEYKYMHIWKMYCMLCTIAASFKANNGLEAVLNKA